MLPFALEDSGSGRRLLFRLSQAHHDKPAIALNLDVPHVPCINPGLLSGLRWDDHLTSIRDSGYHAKRLGQAILAVNPDHQFQALCRFARLGGQRPAEFGMRFDLPHDVQQVFLAFAGAVVRVLPGEILSTQCVGQTRHALTSSVTRLTFRVSHPSTNHARSLSS